MWSSVRAETPGGGAGFPPAAGSLAPLLLAGGLSALLACASAPGPPTHPQAPVVRSGQRPAGDTIPYRALSRADFRSPTLPAAASGHASIGAYSCTTIVPDRPSRVSLAPGPRPGTYLARTSGTSFHAELDRSCSWWTPDRLPAPAEYVLQHEQIHFALVEIQARRLTAEMALVEVAVETPESAGTRMQEHYNSMLAAAVKQLVREVEQFDRETSFGYAPERQAEWLTRVERELARTGHP